LCGGKKRLLHVKLDLLARTNNYEGVYVMFVLLDSETSLGV